MTEIERKLEKTRRNVRLSGEFDAAYRALTPEYVEFTGYVEAALWRVLIDKHGKEAVLEAVEEAQNETDESDLMREARRNQYELPQ